MSSDSERQYEKFHRALARIGWVRQQVFIAIAVLIFAQIPVLSASILFKVTLTISLVVLLVKSLNDAQINAEILKEIRENKESENRQ